MKKTLSILFLLLGSIWASAQNLEVQDTTNKWTVTINSNTMGSQVHNVYYQGDTILKSATDTTLFQKKDSLGLSFKILVETGAIVNARYKIREDLGARKVWGWRDTVPVLLYNYNLKVGDTLLTENGILGQYYKSYVTQVDSVQLGAKFYKVQVFKFTQSWVSHIVVEGIGSLSGPMYPMLPAYNNNFPTLSCFTNHGATPVVTTPSAVSFKLCALGVNDKPGYNNAIELVPNPLHGSGTLRFANTIKAGRVDVYSITGQKIMSRQVTNAKSVAVEALSPGQYFYIVADQQQGAILTGKFTAE